MLIFISMTFCRTILFRRKEGGPRLRGVDSGLLTAVGGFRGWNPLGEGEAENEGRSPPGGGDDIRLKRGGDFPL